MDISLNNSLPKLVLTLAYALSFFNVCFGQSTKSLKVGDKIPNTPITGLVKGSEQISADSLLTKGPVIINFWATWCVPCAEEMRILATEVKKYGGKLSVVCIGYEDRATVNKYLNLHPELKNSGLIITSDDKTWVKIFYHQAVPHNIWLNNKGVIQSITGGGEITAKNISDFVSNQTVKLYQKNDVPFDWKKPLHLADSLIEYRSIFYSKTLPDVFMGVDAITSHRWGIPVMKRFFSVNATVLGLFWNAYQMPGYWTYQSNDYLVEIRTRDSSKYFWPGQNHKTGDHLPNYNGISQDEWMRNHSYSYELRIPKPMDDSLFFNKVRAELTLNLGIKNWQELRKKSCIVVTRFNNEIIFKPTDPKDTTYSIQISGNKFIMKNGTMDKLLEFILMHTYTAKTKPRIEPYINQTNLVGRFSIECDLGNDRSKYISQPYLENCIAEQLGLKFEFTTQNYPVLILQDLDYQ